MRKYMTVFSAVVLTLATLSAHRRVVRIDEAKPPVIKISTPAVTMISNVTRRMAQRGGLITFLSKMSTMESNQQPDVINQYGMMGKYQFNPKTVKALGFQVTNAEFLGNETLQDSVMVAYLRANKRLLRDVIRDFNGKIVNGVLVTESGILAGAHLAGSGGVLAFFYPDKYPHKTTDQNGATVAMYMQRFGGYEVRGI